MVLLFSIKIAVWPPLFIRFTVRVFRERLSIFVCVLLSLLVFRWDVGFNCINS